MPKVTQSLLKKSLKKIISSKQTPNVAFCQYSICLVKVDLRLKNERKFLFNKYSIHCITHNFHQIALKKCSNKKVKKELSKETFHACI